MVVLGRHQFSEMEVYPINPVIVQDVSDRPNDEDGEMLALSPVHGVESWCFGTLNSLLHFFKKDLINGSKLWILRI